jgi:hypothetical protein
VRTTQASSNDATSDTHAGAVPGSSRLGRDDVRLCTGPGERDAARGSCPWRAREAHRAAGRELIGLARLVYGGGAERQRAAAVKKESDHAC